MWSRLIRFTDTGWGMAICFAMPIFFALLFQLTGITEILTYTYQPFQFSYLSFYKNAILDGESIFWNPYVFSGFPIFASVTGGFFSPIFYIALRLFSVPVAYHWLTFFDLLLMGFFTARVARTIGISVVGQYIAGLIYVFSAWQYIFFLPAINALVLLPFLVWRLFAAEETPRYWLTLVGSLSVGFGWFSSHWQWLLLVLMTVGCFAVFLSLQQWRRGSRNFLLPVGRYVSVCVAGSLIGLLQIVPTLAFIPLSVQLAGGYSYATDINAGLNIPTLITLFLPYFEHPFLTMAPLYVGILPLFLFMAGFEFSLRRVRGFLSWFFVAAILFAVAYSPLFWLLQHIPPFQFIHGPLRWIYMGFFAFALLAGFGFDEFSDKIKNARTGVLLWVMKWFLLVGATAAAASAFLLYIFRDRLLFLLYSYFDEFIYKSSMHYNLDYYHAYLTRILDATLRLFDPLNIRFVLPFLIVLIVYVFVRYCRAQSDRFHILGKYVAPMIVMNFIFVFWAFPDTMSGQKYLNGQSRTAGFLIAQPEGRVFTFLGTQSLFEKLTVPYAGEPKYQQALFDFNTELLLLNTNVARRIPQADFLEPMAARPMAQLLSYLGSTATDKFNGMATTTLANISLSITQKSFLFTERRPIISLLGIRYITSAYPLDETIFPKIFETTATSKNIPVYIYENTEARPLYYFTKETELVDLPSSVTPQEIHALIEQTEKTDSITQDGITLQERKNAALTFTTRISKPQLFVLSQNNLPGWRVFIDNERVPLHTFATVYQAVAVPQGMHDIRFEYSYGEIWREFFVVK